MNRRSFLKILTSSFIVATLPSFADADSYFRHTLHGDGITDDTDALQALFDGEEVVFNGKILKIENGTVYIPSGTYVVDNSMKEKGMR